MSGGRWKEKYDGVGRVQEPFGQEKSELLVT